MPMLSATPFMPDKLCRSVDDAKRFAAENVLAHLHVNTQINNNGLCCVLLTMMMIMMMISGVLLTNRFVGLTH